MRGSWVAIGVIMLVIGALANAIGFGMAQSIVEEQEEEALWEELTETEEEKQREEQVWILITGLITGGGLIGLIGFIVMIAGILLKPIQPVVTQQPTPEKAPPPKAEVLSKEKRLELLEDRLARGEISEDTYKKLKKELEK